MILKKIVCTQLFKILGNFDSLELKILTQREKNIVEFISLQI